MDSNKIHIDELVRQRLQGGEEEPRPGAWLSMRELLDKQMPLGSRPPGGFALGNAARWTTALLLLTLIAGGYGALDIRRASREISAHYSAPPTGELSTGSSRQHIEASPAASRMISVSSVNDATAPALEEAAGKISRDNPGADVHASKNAHHAFAGKRSTPVLGKTPGGTTSNSENGAKVAVTPVENANEKSGESNSSKSASARRKSKIALGKTENKSKNVTSAGVFEGGQFAAVSDLSVKESNSKSEKTASANKSLGKSARGEKRSRLASDDNSATIPALSSASVSNGPRNGRLRKTGLTSGRKSVGTSDSIKAQVKRDTIPTIHVAHRYMSTRGLRGGRYVMDTLAATHSIIERPLPEVAVTTSAEPAKMSSRGLRKLFVKKTPAPVDATIAASTSPVRKLGGDAAAKKSSEAAPVLSASAPVASAITATSETLVPLSTKMVRSTTSEKMQYLAQEQIQDVVRRTQFLFGQMRLYSGATGGFNASVGGTSMGGFQAGLFGLLAINDRWSAGIEGKFVQRFNRGTTLQDPYFHYRASTFNRFEKNGEAYNVYRVTTDSFDHYYKLSTLESIELPVYGRYSFHRFHAFAGANLSYGLRVKNIERVERFAGRTSENDMDTVLASVQYAPPANTAANVKTGDFGPRFGIGYTAGVGYQASPAVLVDIRMTQLVWDNRSTKAGGLRVSQTYYRVPSLQLSIGYRFSQRMSRR